MTTINGQMIKNHLGFTQYVDVLNEYCCPCCELQYVNVGAGVLCEQCELEGRDDPFLPLELDKTV